MKTKNLLTMGLLLFATSVSAQIQLLYTNYGRDVIDRNKKLFWMDGDDDPCFDIVNYKKNGNKETFTLVSKKNKNDKYNVVTTVNEKLVTTHIVLKSGNNVLTDSDVKTSSGNANEDNHLYEYFGELAGYPSQPRVGSVSVSSTPTVKDVKNVKEDGAKGLAEKAGDAAKGAFGKVKGLFKKKK